MKKYLVFYGDNHYPKGGWSDFKNSFDSMFEAKNFLIHSTYDWCQIVDKENGEVVFQGNKL